MKRYELEYTASSYSEHRDLVERPDGDWVRWEDVARDGVLTEALKANVMMDVEVERLRAALRKIERESEQCDCAASRTATEALDLAPEPKPAGES